MLNSPTDSVEVDNKVTTQETFSCSKPTIKTLEKAVTYVQS